MKQRQDGEVAHQTWRREPISRGNDGGDPCLRAHRAAGTVLQRPPEGGQALSR